MAWHALSLLINQLQAGMQMCVTAVGPVSQGFFCVIIQASGVKFLRHTCSLNTGLIQSIAKNNIS